MSQWRQRHRGPGTATERPSIDRQGWWKHDRRVSVSAAATRMAASPLDQSERTARETFRLETLASAAVGAQDAPDEYGVLEAVGLALELHGLGAHISILDPLDQRLVVRRVVLPWSIQAQIEQVRGGPMIGMVFDAGNGTAHQSAVREGSPMYAPDALAWVIGVARVMVPDEEQALAGIVGCGEVCLAPLTDGQTASGMITIWAPRLSRVDRAMAAILGRLAGGALSAQGASADSGRVDGAPEKSFDSALVAVRAA